MLACVGGLRNDVATSVQSEFSRKSLQMFRPYPRKCSRAFHVLEQNIDIAVRVKAGNSEE